MRNILEIKLFLSSPSDVYKERDVVADIICEINHENTTPNVIIKLYRWEDEYISDWGTYQEKINKELHDTDIFFGILWNRFGSPTKEFSSGTEEEFERAYEIKEKGKDIELCFLKCEKAEGINSNNSSELDQRKKVNDFFRQKNNCIFSCTKYSGDSEFRRKAKKAIIDKTKKILKQKTPIDEIVNSFRKNGITQLYTTELNDKRNFDKIQFLKNEIGDIHLLAHSGNSYLHTSRHGNPGRFFKNVLERLHEKSGKFKIILLNPYSLEARKIFYAENFNLYSSDISSIKKELLESEGKNLQRFEKCLEGVEEMEQELGNDKDKIEVRISNVATDGTIIMSSKRLFFEPYISSRFINRIKAGLNLFEIQIENLLNNKQCSSVFNAEYCDNCLDKKTCSQNLYKTISEQFHILWEIAIPLKEYYSNKNKYIKNFECTQPSLFDIQLFQLHDSWYAFDPVIGCKGKCSYCFLRAQGWTDLKIEPRKKFNEEKTSFLKKAYKSIEQYPYYKTGENNILGHVPISIGNKTDMFYKDNIDDLFFILDLHEKSNNMKTPIVLITKQLISNDTFKKLGKYSFIINIFYSISFLSSDYEPSIPLFKKRLESAKKNRELIRKGSITNIKMIHYWRPVINKMELSIDEIFGSLTGVFDCSVCIGLQINEDIYNFSKAKKNILLNFFKEKNIKEKDIKEGILIFEPSFGELAKKSLENDYPLFKHTSCAISSVQGKADYNGTMWRDDFCDFCISNQKSICDKYKREWIENNNVTELKKQFKNCVNSKRNCFEIINTTISQEEINYWTHLIGKPIFSDSIRFSLVWPSSNYIYFKKTHMIDKVFDKVIRDYPSLLKPTERMKGITGFVSIIGNDERVRVFNRYNHILRVTRLLKWYIMDVDNIDHEKCAFIGLFHDLNRLPFAHNLEKHIGYSQADTIESYLKENKVNVNPDYINDFIAFFNNNINFSRESRIVFLIDAVSGAIEDTLFALSIFGFKYSDIKKETLDMLGYSDLIKLEKHIEYLNKLYNSDGEEFNKEFNNVTFDYAKSFISRHKSDSLKIFSDELVLKMSKKIEELSINSIFPINNEKVSKGSMFYNEVGKPYIEKMKTDGEIPWRELFELTDSDFLNNAIIHEIISENSVEKFYPDLNFTYHK